MTGLHLRIGFFLLYLLFSYGNCRLADGVCKTSLWGNGKLTESMLKSSSHTDQLNKSSVNCCAGSTKGGWCGDKNGANWIEITFPKPIGIRGIIIQRPQDKQNVYVKSFNLQYQQPWRNSLSNYGNDKNAPTNIPAVNATVGQTTISMTGIVISKLKINIVSFEQEPCLRFDILGCTTSDLCPDGCLNGGSCSHENTCVCTSGYTGNRCETKDQLSRPAGSCQTPLGMRSGAIPKEMFTVSSSAVGKDKEKARYGCCEGEHVGAWCPNQHDKNPWFQVEFPRVKALKVIRFQHPGRVNSQESPDTYMKTFRLDFVSPLDPERKWRTFAENIPAIYNSSVHYDITLIPSVVTDKIKIVPMTSERAPCFRFELLGCDPTDLCGNDWCKNGGTCMGVNICQCLKGFNGDQCENSAKSMTQYSIHFKQITQTTITTTTSLVFQIHGNVQLQTENNKKVLHITGTNSYTTLQNSTFSSCLSDTDRCLSGFTISLNVNFLKITDNTYIISSGGNLKNHKGFALYYIQNKLYCVVTTSTQTWQLQIPYTVKLNVWQNFELSWSKTLGLEVYSNNNLIGSVTKPFPATASEVKQISIGFGYTQTTSVNLKIEGLKTYDTSRSDLVRDGIVTPKATTAVLTTPVMTTSTQAQTNPVPTTSTGIKKFNFTIIGISGNILITPTFNFTVYGHPTLRPEPDGGVILVLNKTGQYVELPNKGLECVQDMAKCDHGFTLQVEVKLLETNSTHKLYIFSSGGDKVNSSGIALYIWHNELYCSIKKDRVLWAAKKKVDFNLTLWHKYQVSWNNKDGFIFYIDGHLFTTHTQQYPNPDQPNVHPLLIAFSFNATQTTKMEIKNLYTWTASRDILINQGVITEYPTTSAPSTTTTKKSTTLVGPTKGVQTNGIKTLNFTFIEIISNVLITPSMNFTVFGKPVLVPDTQGSLTLVLNKTGRYIELPNNGLECLIDISKCQQGFTLRAEIKFLTQNFTNRRLYIFSSGGDVPGTLGITLFVESNTLKCWARAREELWYNTKTITFDVTQWHIYQISWNPKDGFYVYIDGKMFMKPAKSINTQLQIGVHPLLIGSSFTTNITTLMEIKNLYTWTASRDILIHQGVIKEYTAATSPVPTTPYVKQTTCGKSPVDIVFLIDESSSIGFTNFAIVKTFVKNLIKDLMTDSGKYIQIGLVTFARDPDNKFWLNQFDNANDMTNAIDKITYGRRGTEIAKGLTFVRKNSFSSAHGSRYEASKILILFTDGQSSNSDREADRVHKAGITTMVIGVTSHIDKKQLLKIASKPDYLTSVNDFNGLDAIKQKFLKDIPCEEGNMSTMTKTKTTEKSPIVLTSFPAKTNSTVANVASSTRSKTTIKTFVSVSLDKTTTSDVQSSIIDSITPPSTLITTTTTPLSTRKIFYISPTNSNIVTRNFTFISIRNNILITPSLNLTVHGSTSVVKEQKGKPVILLNGTSASYIDFGNNNLGCIDDLSACKTGFTFKIEMNFVTFNKSQNVYLFSSGGENQGSNGVSLYFYQNKLNGYVSTNTRFWSLHLPLSVQTNTWHTYELSWSYLTGIQLYVDQSFVSSSNISLNVNHTSTSQSSLLVIGTSIVSASFSATVKVRELKFWTETHEILLGQGLITTGYPTVTPETSTKETNKHTAFTSTPKSTSELSKQMIDTSPPSSTKEQTMMTTFNVPPRSTKEQTMQSNFTSPQSSTKELTTHATFNFLLSSTKKQAKQSIFTSPPSSTKGKNKQTYFTILSSSTVEQTKQSTFTFPPSSYKEKTTQAGIVSPKNTTLKLATTAQPKKPTTSASWTIITDPSSTNANSDISSPNSKTTMKDIVTPSLIKSTTSDLKPSIVQVTASTITPSTLVSKAPISTSTKITHHTTSTVPGLISRNLTFISIVNNIILTPSLNLTVHGTTSIVKENNKSVLLLNGTAGSYIDFGQSNNISCIDDLSSCKTGFTFKIDMNFLSFNHNKKVFIFSSGGENPGSTGISLYCYQHKIYAFVNSNGKSWSVYIPVNMQINIWHTYELSWKMDSGIGLHIDNTPIASNNQFTTHNGSTTSSQSLLIGTSEFSASYSATVKIGEINVWSVTRKQLMQQGILNSEIPKYEWNFTTSVGHSLVIGSKFNLTIKGGAKMNISNGIELTTTTQYIDFGNHPNLCIGNLALCYHGITIQITVMFIKLEENTVIMTSGGEKPDGTGLALIYRYGKVQCVVSNSTVAWYATISRERLTLFHTHTIIISWSNVHGLKIIVDGHFVQHTTSFVEHHEIKTPQEHMYIGSPISSSTRIDYFVKTVTIWHIWIGIIIDVGEIKPAVNDTTTTTVSSTTRTSQITTSPTTYCPIGCVCKDKLTTPTTTQKTTTTTKPTTTKKPTTTTRPTTTTTKPKPVKPSVPTKPVVSPGVDNHGSAFFKCKFEKAKQPNVEYLVYISVNDIRILSQTVSGKMDMVQFAVSQINEYLYNKKVTCSIQAKFIGQTIYTKVITSAVFIPTIKLVTTGKIILIEGKPPKSIQVSMTSPPQMFCCKGCKGNCQVHIVTHANYDRHFTRCNSFRIPQVLVGWKGEVQSGKGETCGTAVRPIGWKQNIEIPITANADMLYDRDHTSQFIVKAHILDVPQPIKPGFVATPHTLDIGKVAVEAKNNDHKSMCGSLNDPHITTFDKKRYDNFNEGEFILYRHRTLPFEVRARYSKCSNRRHHGRRSRATCNCAVAIKSGDDVITFSSCDNQHGVWQKLFNRHAPIKVEMYKNGDLTPGTLIRRIGCGQKYEVRLPTGTFITIQSSLRSFINVWIRPSSLDYQNTEGLCGSYDRNPNNDVIDGNGRPVPGRYPDKFSLMWRTKLTMFLGVQASQLTGITTFCSCVNTMTSFCRGSYGSMQCWDPRYDITSTVVRQAKVPRAVRQKRDADVLDDTDLTLDNTTFMSHTDAVDKCEHYITNNAAAKSCQTYLQSSNITSNMSERIENCASDLELTGNEDWAQDHVRDIIEECLAEAERQPTNANTTNTTDPGMPQINQNDMCLEDCGQNGNCKQGVCDCDVGYTGDYCNISSSTKPGLITTPLDGLGCDMRITDDCKQAVIFGNNFVESADLTCHYQYIQVGSSVKKIKLPGSVAATYISMTQVICPLPDIKDTNGAYIRVSNDGTTESDDVFIHLVYDSTCFDCFIENNTDSSHCERRPYTCMINGECFAANAKKSDNKCKVCDPSNTDSLWTSSDATECISKPLPETDEESRDQYNKTVIMALGVVCGVLGFFLLISLIYICKLSVCLFPFSSFRITSVQTAQHPQSKHQSKEFGEYDFHTKQLLHRSDYAPNAMDNPTYDEKL